MFKNIKIIIVIVGLAFAQVSLAEEIISFDSDIIVNSDASINITETINYDFGLLERRGIFRFIPENYVVNDELGNAQNTYGMDIKIISVLRNDSPEPYNIEGSGTEFSVKIGDPNVIISGAHEYQIKYAVSGAVRYFQDYDELYWNVTGNGWEIPIRKATAKISSPAVSFDRSFCYAGINGSQNACNQKQKNGNTLFFSQANLAAGQGLTIASSFNKGDIPVVQYPPKKPSLFSQILSFVSTFGAPLVVLIVSGIIVFVKNRQKKKHYFKQSIVPQYEPLDDLNPIFTGFLMDQSFDPRDITAGIIYAAQQGFITISYIESTGWFRGDDYLFTLNKQKYNTESPLGQDVMFILSLLFEEKSHQSIDRFLGDSIDPDSIRLLSERKLSDIKKQRGKNIYEKQETTKYLETELVKKQYLEQVNSFGKVIRLTRLGWEKNYHLKGFKLFLSMTEKERYEFFNNPKQPVEEFMEYIPYAIAFGVEKQWAEQFKNLVIEQPEWFEGNTRDFTSSIAVFSASINSSVKASTTAKGSGSGSGGSGSSGGGAGGGGGGSW